MIKKLLFFVMFFMAMTLSAPASNSALAFEGPGCMGECVSCHTLTKEEAGKLLKTERFRADIKDIRMSPVKGLWEVEIAQGPRTFVVYMDFAKKFLVEGRFTPLEKLAQDTELKKIDVGEIPLTGAIVLGNPEAAKKVIVFSDPECPYCGRLHQELKKIVKERDDVAFFTKIYPLPSHPNAYKMGKAIVCANSEKMLEDAFAGKKLPEPACETDELDKNIKLAQRFNISGTPTIIFPDGRVLSGYVTAETLLGLLDNAGK